MAELIYCALTSLDGYTADPEGDFSWAEPEPEVHRFVNDLERGTGTALYGRRMYEVMRYWATADTGGGETPAVEQEYARIWQGLDKVVFSSTLREVDTPRTRLEPVFDPAVVRRFVDDAEQHVSISGPTLGGQALTAGIVDEVLVFLAPVVIGRGLAFFPPTRVDLRLVETRTFPRGTVLLRYRT